MSPAAAVVGSDAASGRASGADVASVPLLLPERLLLRGFGQQQRWVYCSVYCSGPLLQHQGLLPMWIVTLLPLAFG